MTSTILPRQIIIIGSSRCISEATRHVNLLVVVVGDFKQHFVEVARFLADGHHIGNNQVNLLDCFSGAAKVSPCLMEFCTLRSIFE